MNVWTMMMFANSRNSREERRLGRNTEKLINDPSNITSSITPREWDITVKEPRCAGYDAVLDARLSENFLAIGGEPSVLTLHEVGYDSKYYVPRMLGSFRRYAEALARMPLRCKE